MTADEAKKQVGRGWAALIDKLFASLPPDAIVTGIKEKFGALRVEASGIDENIIEGIELKSRTTCEICGGIGQLVESSGGWFKTRCERHLKYYGN
jgi:hypothetical protein